MPNINMNPPQVYHVPHPEPSSLLPPCTIPLGHPSAPAPSILYYASNLDWRFISYMILYIFQCHSPKSSPLSLSHRVQKTVLYICVSFPVSYRLIFTIFLNSIHVHKYTILVFFCLAYFTLYNRLQFHPPY